jgi:hypothetical protein
MISVRGKKKGLTVTGQALRQETHIEKANRCARDIRYSELYPTIADR